MWGIGWRGGIWIFGGRFWVLEASGAAVACGGLRGVLRRRVMLRVWMHFAARS